MATCVARAEATVTSFPEEIDLFTIPHACMRQLLGEYSRQPVREEGEADLQRVVAQVKKHEAIEDKYIMERLRHKPEFQSLKPCSAHAALDTHLATLVSLLRSPCNCSVDATCSCLDYALNDLVATLLAHMKEEEEVFQPMLVQYFDYEELKTLRQVVISQHQWSDEGLWMKTPTPALEFSMRHLRELEGLDCQAEVWEAEEAVWWEEEDTDRMLGIEKTSDARVSSDHGPFSQLPWEVRTHIFSFLSVFDLVQCSQVCIEWHYLAFQPCYWRTLTPADSWKTLHTENGKVVTTSKIAENQKVEWLADQVLPHVASHIHTLVLTGSQLSSQQLRLFLASCLQLRHLNVSCTSISSLAFSGLASPACTRLRHLDISGNPQLRDSALFRLARLWEGVSSATVVPQRPVCTLCSDQTSSTSDESCESLGLQFLSLSGCHSITKYGIARLAASGMLCNLAHLDLSGCCGLSGKDIAWVVAHCPRLLPQDLAYCDNIVDGPYPCLASSCHNVGSSQRFCCRRD